MFLLSQSEARAARVCAILTTECKLEKDKTSVSENIEFAIDTVERTYRRAKRRGRIFGGDRPALICCLILKMKTELLTWS